MWQLLLLFLPLYSCLDFRSQAYKNADVYGNIAAAINSLSASNLGASGNNPYMQFSPLATLAPAQQTVDNPVYNNPGPIPPSYNQLSMGSADPKQSESTLYNQMSAQPSFPLADIVKQQQQQQQQNALPMLQPQQQLQQSNVQYWLPQNVTNPLPSESQASVTTEQTQGTPEPVIWTTKKPTTKQVAKMSKLSKPLKKEDKNTAAQVLVPSHRLLNDILVIPSTRRLYILALIPIHESYDNKGFECGKVDSNGFSRLAAFLDALDEVNNKPILKDAGLGLGAVIVDSCSSDLRTVADLYELLSGTNIQKSDLIGMVRDDGSYLPNVDDFAKHLRIPVINTFFATHEHLMVTGTLPSIHSPMNAMLSLLMHTKSSCVSLLYDDLYEDSVRVLDNLAMNHRLCIEQRLTLKGGSLSMAETAVRRLLLTEARLVIVLLGEGSWIQLMKALRTEMVITGRFILLTLQNPRWFNSKQFLEMWPHFDQLLLTVTSKTPKQSVELQQLTSRFPSFPFPQHWMRQFWSSAFRCHIEGENENGQQFSKECSQQQLLNLTSVAPDLDIAPISLAVHSIAHATRRLVDNVCPGALIQSLNDCLNEPQEALFSSLMSVRFTHNLANGEFFFNESSGYRDVPMVINRVIYDSQLEVEQLAEWDSKSGFLYTAPMDLVMEERDGSRVPLRSTCPKSACIAELTKRTESGNEPTFQESLSNTYLLLYTIGAVLASFICMLCMYHQIVCSRNDMYTVCTTFMFAGLSILCLMSVFFIMAPNFISCIGRRIGFSIALSTIFSPILVKTLAIWRLELGIVNNNGIGGESVKPNQSVLFWICFALVVLQGVISVEWSLFESPVELTFASSNLHGHQWRCGQGENFEQKLLNSCALTGLMIVISLVCSILSVRHLECRQNILITIIGGGLAIGLYLGLPLAPYHLRDQIIAGVLLAYSFLIILITYCRGAFTKENDDSNKCLVDRSTLDRSEKNPYWLENMVLSPRGQCTMTLQRNYHQSTTLPQGAMDKYAVEGFVAPRINSQLAHPQVNDPKNGIPRLHAATMQRPQSQPGLRYGVESYELPPSSPHPVHYQSQTLPFGGKYGQQEFVLEEEEDCNSRL